MDGARAARRATAASTDGTRVNTTGSLGALPNRASPMAGASRKAIPIPMARPTPSAHAEPLRTTRATQVKNRRGEERGRIPDFQDAQIELTLPDGRKVLPTFDEHAITAAAPGLRQFQIEQQPDGVLPAA